MSKLRFRVVEKAFQTKPVEVPVPSGHPSEYFAKYVFNREKMFKYLSNEVYAQLIDAIDNGAVLDRKIADQVAEGMKCWASQLGATHYTHWFQPLTEGTAEKHDSFVEPDGKGGMIEEFSGKLLVQQEPDASSFPNGGIRNTFEARGYSAWDPSSPVFVVDDTLCIPTVFIAYTGESLDYKAPLLKALRAVNETATRLAVDHNMLLMVLMRKVARIHGFRVLLHEKPFKGINGLGKHNNWSLGTDTGIFLLAPGKTPEENLRFITFIVNTLMAVYRHNGLLKASIMSATNAHRLGANEAPPAIISSFLGTQLTPILDHLEESPEDQLTVLGGKQGMKLDIPQIPELLIDNTDRNRTSPFAFTGNRFDFRAVGSEANCASAMIALNTAVSEQLADFKEKVDLLMEKGESKVPAILKVIRSYIKECKPIRFDGNGYSNEWKEEALRRGLDCETSCPVIYDQYLTPQTIRMFESVGVMTQKELEARNEVKWETYTKKIQIEARVLGDLVMNHIVPIAIDYQTKLIENVYKMRCLFPADEADKLSAENSAIVREIAEHTIYIKKQVDAMIEARKTTNKITDEREKAIAYHDIIAPMLEQIRYRIDKLELIVDDQMWTLPKYRELLFVR